MQFNVYTGDGNVGVGFDHEIEAKDLDAAVAVYMEGVFPKFRDSFQEDDGDEHHAVLMVLEHEGARALNGGAFFVAEIWDARNDPRV